LVMASSFTHRLSEPTPAQSGPSLCLAMFDTPFCMEKRK
jgi:hypothetical protein